MTRLFVQHNTLYRYHRPVGFGEHRLMFRPRDSHDMRLIDTALVINPVARVRWMHDVFSNSIAIARFDEPASELRFESRIELEHFGSDDAVFPVAPLARLPPLLPGLAALAAIISIASSRLTASISWPLRSDAITRP